MMEFRLNIAVVEPQQIWNRNKTFKNWGKYHVFKFVKGEPTYYISSYISLIFKIAIILAFFIISLNQMINISNSFNIKYILILINNCLATYFCYLFYRQNPGICSSSAPIINQHQAKTFKNFCISCKCLQTGNIKHCQKCDVCVDSSIIHANISNNCISNTNVKYFCWFWLFLGLQSLIYFII